MQLRITLMGEFRLEFDERPIVIESPRVRSLLAYLVLHPSTAHPRQYLSFLFWPESTEAQARTNLRQLLHHLRGVLPHPERFLLATRRTLQWNPDGGVVSDVDEIEAAWAAARSVSAPGEEREEIRALERAAGRYAGELLPSCYDEWIDHERVRLRRGHEAALTRLIHLLEERHRYREAAGYAARLLELDPLREETYRTCIRLHGLAGEPALAARAFRACVDMLADQFEVEPAAETRQLYERIARAAEARKEPAMAVTEFGSSNGHAELRISTRVGSEPVDLVGRQAEWVQLRAQWDAAIARGPRVALLAGEPGIGKSRLAAAFLNAAALQGVPVASARCYAAEGLLPFGPVAQWLRSEPLRNGAARLDEIFTREIGRLVPELHGGAAEDGLQESAEPGRRLRLFEALARGVLASGAPLLLALDDLQWCDADTLEWLHYLLRFDTAQALLVLVTLRLGELDSGSPATAWLLQLEAQGRLESLPLGPLSESETAVLAHTVAGEPLAESQARELYRQTRGNPLFVVEYVRAGEASSDAEAASSGAASRPASRDDDGIPARVQAVIRSRLDRLSPDARALAAYAAAFGRQVPWAVLRPAAEDEMTVARALDELCQRAILREDGPGTYDFSHDRIREIAYGELSHARRAVLHHRAARALERLHGGDPDLAGEIARHLERADRIEDAIPFYRQAADRALALFANEEAVRYLERAHLLVELLPESPARAELELDLHTRIGVPLVALYHYAGRRVLATYQRAREIAAALGRPASPPVLRGLALASLMRSRIPEVLRLGRSLLSAARETADPMLAVEAHYVLGVTFFWHGRIAAARRHLRRALDRYDPERAPAHLRLYAQDPRIICGIRLALAEWHAGLEAPAHARCLEAIESAVSLGHPFTLAYARYFGCFVLIEAGDLSEARRQVAALGREAQEYRLASWPTTGAIFEGWLRLEAGDESGLEMMLAAAREYENDGVSLGFPYHQGLLARAYGRLGRTAMALAAIAEGLEMADRTGEHFWTAELLRLKGDLLDDRGAASEEVEACYRAALERARRQGSRALELRARKSLRGRLAAELPGPSRTV